MLIMVYAECPVGQFSCEGATVDGKRMCIPDAKVCDGYKDCSTNLDEELGVCFQKNHTKHFVSSCNYKYPRCGGLVDSLWSSFITSSLLCRRFQQPDNIT